jgi:7-keto-8-aminopelargonate synthetase-like enzyme
MPCRIEPATPAPPSAATPLPAALGWIAEALDQLAAAGLERPQRTRDGRQGATVDLDGRRLVNVGSNDYLGYAGDVRLTKAASKAAKSSLRARQRTWSRSRRVTPGII